MPVAPELIQEITDLPLSTDPVNFDERADQSWTELKQAIEDMNVETERVYDNALEVFEAVTEIAAVALVASDAAGFVATSTSTLVVGPGSKTIHFQAAKPKLAVATYQLAIVLASDNSIKMVGNVDTTDGSDDISVNVVLSGVSGTGTYSGPWLIIAGAFLGTGATAPEVLAASSDVVAVSPKSLKDALARFVLTDGSPVTGLSGLNGLDFFWTLTANRTMPQLTNTYPGARGTITAKQDGVGGRILAVHSSFKRRGGLGVLSTATGAEDEIPYEVKTVDGSGNATRVIYDVIKAPS